MIVRNEERFLRECLASVAGVVDEICIVDTGSTDGTLAIAESFGARVERIDWRDDFSYARNAALAMARHPWILVLDADERLMPGSRAELAALRGIEPAGRGRWIRCHNVNDDIRGGPSSTNAIVRIFPRDPAIRYRGALHEFIAREGQEHALPADRSGIELQHFGYTASVFAGREKAQRNLRVAQAALDADPADPFHHYNFAMSSLLAGDMAGARTSLERVAVMTEGMPRGFRPQALATLAGLQLESDPAAALETIDRCVAIAPTFPDGHFVRGKVLATLGRLHDARNAYGAAIEAGRFVADHFVTDEEIPAWRAHAEIAATLMNEERWAEALQWLELASKARPAVMLLVLNRARCHEALGDLASALALFRAAVDGYRDEMAAIEYVNFVFRHGSPDTARAAVEHALPAVNPDYQRAFLATAAATMLRADRRDEAVALVEQALAVGGSAVAGRAVVSAMAKHHGLPELAKLASAGMPLNISVPALIPWST